MDSERGRRTVRPPGPALTLDVERARAGSTTRARRLLDRPRMRDNIRAGTEQIPKPMGRTMIFLDSLRKLRPRRLAPALKPTTYYVPVVSAIPAASRGPRCPECAGPLTRASGCVSCVYCGWGKCG